MSFPNRRLLKYALGLLAELAVEIPYRRRPATRAPVMEVSLAISEQCEESVDVG